MCVCAHVAVVVVDTPALPHTIGVDTKACWALPLLFTAQHEPSDLASHLFAAMCLFSKFMLLDMLRTEQLMCKTKLRHANSHTVSHWRVLLD